ncbi:MAG: tetraacyldisaccharide 4'-kinase [Hyphomonadaceae bacterium]
MLQALLRPAGALYGWVAARRHKKPGARVSVPVVCVGNLTLGGAGKTPVSRHVRGILGESAFVLMRGYGGRARGPLRVLQSADYRDVGDEALLHAQDGATIVSRDRVAGASLAISEGARAIVMDDGFQNPSLAKDLSLVVIDAEAGIGNGRVFPAGPLRERLKDGLARADAFVLMGEGDAPSWLEGRRVLRARVEPQGAAPAGKLVAFAGIARPQKFFDTLAALGAEIAEAVPFSDHHPFSAGDLDWLGTLARERDASLITTEKDFVRIDPARRANIATLPVRARFADEAALAALLEPVRARMSG